MSIPRETVSPAVPWYRQRWPWLLIAGPAIVVVAGFATLWLAASTDDGVIADDYYKRGLVINRTLERTERGLALGIAADLAIAADGGVRVTLGGNAEVAPAALTLKVVHPTRAGFDRTATLARGADGAYTGQVQPLGAGRWRVTLETDTWRLPTLDVDGAGGRATFGASSR
jgi:hypothetical protein